MFFFYVFLYQASCSDVILEYDLDSHTIKKLDPNATEITLDEKYDNDTIIAIGANSCSNATEPMIFAKCQILNLSRTQITRIGRNAFYHAPIHSLILPDTLQEIGLDAFRNIKITELHIPRDIISIDGAFNACESLVNFTIDESNKNFSIDNNIVYSSDYSRIIRASSLTQYEDITHLDCVSSLGMYSFSYGKIVRFEGSPKLKSIEEGTFEQCTCLTDLNLVQTSITTIPLYCFKNSIISFLVLPPKIQKIRFAAFESCNLTSLFLPSSITDIEAGAFRFQLGSLRVFYFGKKPFNDRVIFSIKKNYTGVITIFVPTTYQYSTMSRINVTICSIDEMFIPPDVVRCTIQQCRCNALRLVGISIVAIHH